MLRLAALMVGSRQEAEDVVQEAFLALSLRWDEVDNPGAYLRTSVINGANMVLRRRKASNDRRIPPPSPMHTAHGAEAIELADALAALAPNQRLAIVLRYYLALTDEEIGGHLGCRPSTVRSHLRRGLRTLREELA